LLGRIYSASSKGFCRLSEFVDDRGKSSGDTARGFGSAISAPMASQIGCRLVDPVNVVKADDTVLARNVIKEQSP
jgi:hypothetical protein